MKKTDLNWMVCCEYLNVHRLVVLQYTSRYDYEHAHSNGISRYNINVNFAAVSKLIVDVVRLYC